MIISARRHSKLNIVHVKICQVAAVSEALGSLRELHPTVGTTLIPLCKHDIALRVILLPIPCILVKTPQRNPRH